MVFAHSPSYADAAPYLWSLVLSFALVILSIAPLYVARFKAQFEMSDLSSLRSMFDRYPAWGKRASWAQQNSFESFTLHAPATLLAIFSVMICVDIGEEKGCDGGGGAAHGGGRSPTESN